MKHASFDKRYPILYHKALICKGFWVAKQASPPSNEGQLKPSFIRKHHIYCKNGFSAPDSAEKPIFADVN
jgi:hypothetical protein